MLRRRLSLWQLSLFCLLLMASVCASAITGSPTIHAQSAINSRLLGNNPKFTHVSGRASRAALRNKQLTAKTAHVVSRSQPLTGVSHDPACTSSIVTGTITNRNAVTFTEYTIPTASTSPYSVARSGSTVWFVENGANKIGRLSTSGNTTTITQCNILTAGANLQGITIGPDGNPWFTEADVDKIGTISGVTNTSATVTEYTGLTAGAFPVNITSGPDGNLWFTEQGLSQIGTILTAAPNTVTEFATPTASAGPLSIASDGTLLWFSEPFVDQVASITTAGVATEYTGLTAGSFPFGLTTAGPTGTLWVTEPGTNNIANFSTTTHTITSETPVTTAASNPNFIASFNGTGTLAFNEQSGNNTSTITTGGTHAVTENALPTPNALPLGITSGGTNAVWIAEAGANKIAQVKLHLGNIL